MNEDVKSTGVHIHSRADELIACLEGEIAKRDEELAACRVAVENCDLFRARIAELEARIVWLECEAQVNAAPVSEAKAQGVYSADPLACSGCASGCFRCRDGAKAQGVVMPQSPHWPGDDSHLSDYERGHLQGRCDMRSEVIRLNAAPVQQGSVPDSWKLVPVNATEAILDVLYSNGMDESDSLLQDIWSAMLAAAPAAPEADAGVTTHD